MILDHIGARYLPRNLQTLATGGRMVMIGSMGGEERAEIDIPHLIHRRQQIIGSALRSRSNEEKAGIVSAFLARFGDDLRAGRVRPVNARVFPLQEATEAHRLMKSSEHFGKIVLRIQ